MKKCSKWVSMLLVITLTIPLLAEGRAGARGGAGFSGGGMRSRGVGGFHGAPGGGFYRTQPNYGPTRYTRPVQTAPYAASRSPGFFSGLFSGLLGAWLYSKIFHSEPATTATTTTSTKPNPAVAPTSQQTTDNWSFMRIILMLVVAYLIWRWVRRRRGNGNPRSGYFHGQDSEPKKTNLGDFFNMSKDSPQNLMANLSQNDRNEFENILLDTQNAWSQNNLTGLQRLTTPQMFEHFSNIMRENQQQGTTNHISQVKLLNMELQDMWQEQNSTFARVALTWSALDYVVNNNLSPNDPGYLVDGNMTQPTVATEIWTYQRDNSHWKLADIEQLEG